MKTTIIVSGGSLDLEFAVGFMREHKADCIIGADRGIEFLREFNYLPDYIVGDFDSGTEESLAYFKSLSVPVQKYDPHKDETDTQIALSLALSIGSTCIYILGGTGSRLDHVMGNMKILSMPMKEGIPCFLIDAHNRIRMICENTVIRQEEQFGNYVSLVAHTSEVLGVTLEGFAYPLRDYRLSCDQAIGISNEISEQEAKISLTSGALIVIESID